MFIIKEDIILQNNSYDGQEENYDDEILHGLPLSFKSKKFFFSKKKKHKNRYQVSKALAFSESRSESNIFMGYSHYDGLYYPCRVIGNGPSYTSDNETVMVYYLGYGSYAEVQYYPL